MVENLSAIITRRISRWPKNMVACAAGVEEAVALQLTNIAQETESESSAHLRCPYLIGYSERRLK